MPRKSLRRFRNFFPEVNGTKNVHLQGERRRQHLHQQRLSQRPQPQRSKQLPPRLVELFRGLGCKMTKRESGLYLFPESVVRKGKCYLDEAGSEKRRNGATSRSSQTDIWTSTPSTTIRTTRNWATSRSTDPSSCISSAKSPSAWT